MPLSRLLRRAALSAAVLLASVPANAQDIRDEIGAIIAGCVALGRDFAAAPIGPGWAVIEDRVATWPDSPNAARRATALHRRLPVRMSARARYRAADGTVLESGCVLTPARGADLSWLARGGEPVAYGPEAALDPGAVMAAGRAFGAALLAQGGYVELGGGEARTRGAEVLLRIGGCSEPAVMLELTRHRWSGATWPWTIAATRRRPRQACAAR